MTPETCAPVASGPAPVAAAQPVGTALDGRGARPTLLFVAGCPRSGTTWTQLLLAQHPAVATVNETHLFLYLQPLYRRWQAELARPRSVGLSRLMSAEEFDDLCRSMADEVLRRIHRTRPSATVLLEKTPTHLLMWDVILRLYPEAHFIHVVRDPRSVVSSLLQAGTSWGASWAPRRVDGAVGEWRAAIEAGRRLAAATPRYLEVRYEALLADGATQLERMLAWLGLPFEPGFPARAVEACSLDRLKQASSQVKAPWELSKEPAGFFRRGEQDAWREELSRREVRAIENRLGELMVSLGYPLASRRAPVAGLERRAVEALDALRDRVRRWRRRRRTGSGTAATRGGMA